jgi:WhiB family transcriptional regulator, redox-sensing transcriptional regulator
MSYEHIDFGRPARLHDRSWGSVDSTPHANTGQATTGAAKRAHLTLVTDECVFPSATTDEQWQERALCAQTDPEAFFPEKGGSTREAKRICMGCEVRAECLEYALAHDERFGIWGGLSERERRRLKRGII